MQSLMDDPLAVPPVVVVRCLFAHRVDEVILLILESQVFVVLDELKDGTLMRLSHAVEDERP